MSLQNALARVGVSDKSLQKPQKSLDSPLSPLEQPGEGFPPGVVGLGSSQSLDYEMQTMVSSSYYSQDQPASLWNEGNGNVVDQQVALSKTAEASIDDIAITSQPSGQSSSSTKKRSSICWDVRGKRILDSELQNSMTFLYDDFTQTSTGAMAIVNTLSASIDVPCILYIAFWKIRTSKKRKRKN